MGKQSVSLCIISKNEAGNIGNCIKSCTGYVDEVIVVDTGSSDRTPDIAKELGAKVIFDKWEDDFSKARNVSLEYATGDWILFLDCDEVLAEGSGHKLRDILVDSRYQAYYVTVINVVGNRTELRAPGVRLFRNKKEFRFKGRIHEQIVSSIVNRAGSESLGWCDVEILHYGYDVSKINVGAKIRRNMEILKKYPPSEQDGFYMYNLGTEYFRSNDLDNALSCYLKALQVTKPTKSYGPILVKRTAGVLIRLSRYEEAIRRLRFYQEIYKDYSDLVYMEGLCHMNCGRYTLAASCFQRFLDMPAPPEWYPTNVGDYRGMSRRNLEKINQKLRPAGMPGLSACITGRNEQEQVVSCIKSVNEIASEVIYVDAGSTDSSRDVAAQYGAKVVSTNWDRDYSALKNLAVENASGSWVLVLNSDEVLSAEGFWEVARLLANPEFPGYTVGVRSHLLKGQPVVGSQISGSVRLFKKEQGFVFQGFLGESAVNKEPEVKAGLSGVIIEHMHFLASKEHICEKKKWKQEVIDKMELEHDRNYYMGRLHCFNGEYSLAARFFNSPPSAAWHYYYHAIALMAMPRIGEAKLMLEDGIRRYPDYTDLYYLLARANILAGYFEIAENLLLKCIEMGESSYGKYVVIPGSGGFRALCLLSGLYHKTGRAALAVDTLAKVFEIISQEKIAGWCKPDATSLAVYSLVTLSKYLEKPVSEILAGYGLMNVPNLCVAARAYSALGLFDEGIRYLRLALELMLDDSPLAAGVDRIAKELERLWKSSLARLAQYPGNKSFLRKIGLAGTSGELDGIFTHSI